MTELLYKDLSYKIQGCFFKVYNTLGYGHKEAVYQNALAKEFELQQVHYRKEESLPVTYEGAVVGTYRPDFTVEDKIIIEVKALSFLPRLLVRQLVYYLKGTDYTVGFMVNFGSPKIEIIRRVWGGVSRRKSVVNSRKSILTGLVALFFGLIAVGPRPVHAEPARSGIQVSPLSVEREVYPGEEFFFAVQFFNPLEEPQLIRPRFKDLVVEADGQVNFLDYSSPRYTISRWSDFPKEEIPLGPHEERVLQIKVKVPDDAVSGGHFGALFGEVQSRGDTLEEGSPYQVKQQVAVGVLVFLSVLRDDLGTDVWRGELRDFTLEGKKLGNVFISPEPLSFGAIFDNLGIFHQNVWGSVEITDTQGGRVANLPLRERKVLPGVTMSYFEAWRPTRLLGRYKARVQLHYGRNGENTAEKTMSFYVVDQRLLLSVALAIVVVAALVVIRRPRLLPPSHHHSVE